LIFALILLYAANKTLIKSTVSEETGVIYDMISSERTISKDAETNCLQQNVKLFEIVRKIINLNYYYGLKVILTLKKKHN
jgi:hypothetical protein